MVPGEPGRAQGASGGAGAGSDQAPKGRTAIAIREQTDQLAEAGLGDAPGAVRALRAYVFGAVAVEVQQSGWAEAADDHDEPWRPPSKGGGSPGADADFELGLDALLVGLTRH